MHQTHIGMRLSVALMLISSATAFLAPASLSPLRNKACVASSRCAVGKGRTSLRMGVSVEQGMGKPVSMKSWVCPNGDQVDAEKFELALQTEDMPMIVDFFTTWCGPCKLIAPQLEKIAAEYDGKVKVLKIDTDVEAELASTLQLLMTVGLACTSAWPVRWDKSFIYPLG